MDPPGRKFNMDPPGRKFDNVDSMTRGVDPPGRLDIIQPAPTAPMAPTVSTIIPDKSTSDTTLPASPSTPPPASSATTSETPPMICENDVVYSYVACNHLMSSDANANFDRYREWAANYFPLEQTLPPTLFRKCCREYYKLPAVKKDKYFWKCNRCRQHNPIVVEQHRCMNGCRPKRQSHNKIHRRTPNFRELEKELKGVMSPTHRRDDRAFIELNRCRESAKELFNLEEHIQYSRKRKRTTDEPSIQGNNG